MKKIVYIDMDDVLCDFTRAHKDALLVNPNMKFPQAEFGFFTGLKAINGAIESVNLLINSNVYDPYILTAPSIKNPLCYTEKRIWIEKHFGLQFVNKLIISPNKGLLKGDFLIDDNTEGKGQENFEGQVLQFGGEAYPTWESIMKFLHLNF